MERRLLYKPTECAALMSVSKSWLYAALRRGDIPCVELSPRCLRIPADSLREPLELKLKDKGNW